MLSYFSSPSTLQMKLVWRGKDFEETGCAVAWLLWITPLKRQKCEPGCWNIRVLDGSSAFDSGQRGDLPVGSGLQSCLSRAFLCRSHHRSHTLGSAVLPPLESAAVTRGRFRTDRQVPRSSNGYKYSRAPVVLKPILNHQKVISTYVFSMLGLANVLFLDCYLKKPF